ncbi:MAG TPA: dihydroneopterin aldolase [Elusimicrobiota bacterium]|nr:dihydroneopterin aldolase [Elusimicrobiota bacterium]
MTPRDKIWILGVQCRTRLGVPDEERRRPQPIEIDAGLECDIRRAAKSDDFRHAIDYQKAEQLIRRLAEERPRRLVETLAEEIAQALLRLDVRIAAATVRVHKRPAAMPETREVCVEIRRARRRQRSAMD